VSDPVVREFTGDIRGLSTIGLSVNVTLGEDNDTAIMEVTGANGESTIVGKQVQPPRIAGTRTREDVEPIILAKARALTIAYWQGRLSDASSEEESDNARQKLAALGISDGVGGGIASTTDALTEKEKVLVAMAREGVDVGVGGMEVADASLSLVRAWVAARGENALYAEAQNWYDPNVATPALSQLTVRHDSVVGRIFKGLIQQIDLSGEDASRQLELAAVAEAVTAIPAEKILAALNVQDASAMKRLFEDAGYGSIFLTSSMASNAPAQVLATNVAVVVGNVRVRFDIVTEGKEIATVKLLNATTGEEYGGTRHTTFVEVPLERIAMCSENLQFRVVATFTDDSSKTSDPTEGIAVDAPVSGEILAKRILGAQWDELTQEQRNAVSDALDFGDLSATPQNERIINYLVENYLSNGAMTFDSEKMEWRGEAYIDDPDTDADDLIGECKYWAQMDVIKAATGRVLPPNSSNYEWNLDIRGETVTPLVTSNSSSDNLEEAIKLHATAGDVLQCDMGIYGHTMIIGKVDNDGVWVFDSNASEDKTPRYHKVSFSVLNPSSDFTIYRVNS